MKRIKTFIIIGFILFTTCVGNPVPKEVNQVQKSSPLQTTQTITITQSQQNNPYFIGDGGKGKSITILPPKAVGLTANQSYLPDFVANELVANFSNYTAMTLFDRVNLQSQYNELLSGYYSDNDSSGLDLGHLSSTDYMLIGTITRTSTGFALQLTVNSNSDKTTIASYSQTIMIIELDNLSGVRRASLDLIQKMGITPTERTRIELAEAAPTNHINAQTAMAYGITAQRDGTVVESLSHYIQATQYDPTLLEATSRLNILTANVTSGNIGEDVRNDIQWREQWIARLKECEDFYKNYIKESPPYFLVYSTSITQGEINYNNRTVALSIEVGSFPNGNSWYSTLDQVIKTVRRGLISTGRAQVWGLAEWPQKSLAEPNPFIRHINGYTAEFEIINSEGRIIGNKGIIGLPLGWEIEFPTNRREGNYAIPIAGSTQLVFPSVPADVITDNLNIRITKIDGLNADATARQKNIIILSSSSINNYSNSNNDLLKLRRDYFRGYKAFVNIPTNVNDYSTIWLSNNTPSIVFAIIHYGVTIINEEDFSPNPNTSVNGLLTNVLIPNTVTSIGHRAFYRNQFNELIIPKSVTSIGAEAFTSTRLSKVTFEGTISSNRFSSDSPFSGDLRNVFFSSVGGRGTYISEYGVRWRKIVN